MKGFPKFYEPVKLSTLLGVLALLCLFVGNAEESEARPRERRRPIFQRFAQPQPRAVRQPCRSCFSRPSVSNLGAQRGAQSISTFRNGIVDPRFASRLKEVQGFSNLLSDGRNLFERRRVPIGRGVTAEEVRQIFIGADGAALNTVDPATRVQLRDLYLKNFEAFNGNAKVLVSRFLAANGLRDAFLGNLRVAVAGGALPPGVKIDKPAYANYSPQVVNAAAVAYVLNLISNNPNPIRVTEADMQGDGTIRKNLLGSVDPAGLARLVNDNPYDCEKRGIVRADWLTAKALDPNIYYQLTGLSANQDEFAQQVGFIDSKQAQRGSLMLVAGTRDKPESIVGRNPQRVLQFQRRFNSVGFDGRPRYCFRSHDFVHNPVPGTEEVSRDVFRTGVNFTADAGEWICQRANGFPIYYLSDEAKRQRANEAPAGIAIGFGDTVTVADKCIKCHMNGFHGGRLTNLGKGAEAKPYTDHFGRISPSLGQEFFSKNSQYDAKNHEVFNQGTLGFNEGRDYPAASRHATAIQENALKLAGAYLEDPEWITENQTNPAVQARPLPVVVDLIEEYRKDLTVERQAQELGTSVENVLAISAAGLGMSAADYKAKYPLGQVMRREQFAASYCQLVQQARGGRFESQQRNVDKTPPQQPAHNPNIETSESRPPAEE